MRKAVSLATVLLLAGAALAGCVAEEAGQASQAETQPAENREAALLAAPVDDDASTEAAVPFTFNGTGVNETRWLNGSIGPTGYGLVEPVTWVTGDTRGVVVDLSDAVPREVPVRIDAVVTYEGNVKELRPVSLFLLPGDATVYAHASTEGIDRADLSSTLGRRSDEPVRLRVDAFWPDGSPEIEFTLRVRIHGTPDVIPASAVAAAHLAPGDRVRIDPVGEAWPQVAVWGPDDAFLGRVAVEGGPSVWTVPPDLEAGAYVLMPTGPGKAVRVAKVDPEVPPTSLQLLDVAVTKGVPHALQGGSTTWTFDVARAPVAVGLGIREAQTGFSSTFDASGTVASPAGPVLAFAPTGSLPVGPWPELGRGTWWSETGAPELTAGTYSVEVTMEGAVNVEAYELVRHYVR